MLLDVQNLFFHNSTTFQFTAGEYVSLVGVTQSTASSVINLGVAQDLGIGDGEAIPKAVLWVGTAVTSSSATLALNVQFQGSTDSVTWTTYAESGANTTASYLANTKAFQMDVPRRPAGVALPQYYRLNLLLATNGTAGISTGTVLAGIVMQSADNADTLGLYKSGFSVS